MNKIMAIPRISKLSGLMKSIKEMNVIERYSRCEWLVVAIVLACVAVVLVGAAIGSPEMMAAAGVVIILACTPLMKRYIDEAEKEDEL